MLLNDLCNLILRKLRKLFCNKAFEDILFATRITNMSDFVEYMIPIECSEVVNERVEILI